MDLLYYIFLGVLQGLFEWLPISSEGVVALTSGMLGVNVNVVDLAIFLHSGTLLAVIIYFWKDWIRLVKREDRALEKFLLISVPVSLLVGFPVYKFASSVGFGPYLLFLMGLGLIGTGILQAYKARSKLGLGLVAALSGLMQGLAAIPGLSRSGSTIFAISLGDVKPEDVLRYSYIMSVPVIFLASVYLAFTRPVLVEAWPALVSSFLVGLISLHSFIYLARRISFFWFALVFGLLCLIGATIGMMGFVG